MNPRSDGKKKYLSFRPPTLPMEETPTEIGRKVGKSAPQEAVVQNF